MFVVRRGRDWRRSELTPWSPRPGTVHPGQAAARRRSAAAAKRLDPVDVVPQVLVADVVDPTGDRVCVVGQFFRLVVGGEPLQVAMGHSSNGGEESLVRT